MRARIAEKREVARETLLVVFDLLGQEVDFRPGQYFWVTLLDPPYDDEKGPRRHISVVTSPTERGVLGLCTRLRDSVLRNSHDGSEHERDDERSGLHGGLGAREILRFHRPRPACHRGLPLKESRTT